MIERRIIIDAMENALLASRHHPTREQVECILDAVQIWTAVDPEEAGKAAAIAYWKTLVLRNRKLDWDREWKGESKSGKRDWFAVGAAALDLATIAPRTTKKEDENAA